MTSKIFGVLRSNVNHQEFRDLAMTSFREIYGDAEIDEQDWAEFAEHIHYVSLDAVSKDADWSSDATPLDAAMFR